MFTLVLFSLVSDLHSSSATVLNRVQVQLLVSSSGSRTTSSLQVLVLVLYSMLVVHTVSMCKEMYA